MIDFDEVALKLAKAEADNIILMRKLSIILNLLIQINNTRSVANHTLRTVNGKQLNSGIVFCWTTPDEIHNALTEIKALGEKD